jgi:hypothetical protein
MEATGQECPADSTIRDAFFDTIDGRGIGPRNGYPQTIPLKVGLSNASWYRQSCERLPDGGSCDDRVGTLDAEGRPVPWNSFWGKLSFEDSGHTALSLCDRSTQIWFKIGNEEELFPGDLSGRGASNLKVVGLPKQVTEFDVQFFLPFMHHRADQDLGCPLGAPGADGWESPDDAARSNDAACQQTNRQNARFHFVHTNPMLNESHGKVYNGSHNSLSEVQGNRFLAYAYDARPGGDADGWIGSSNPFFNPALHTPDCDDASYSLENICVAKNPRREK